MRFIRFHLITLVAAALFCLLVAVRGLVYYTFAVRGSEYLLLSGLNIVVAGVVIYAAYIFFRQSGDY